MLNNFVKAAKTSDVPQNTMINVKVEGEDILLANVDGEYYAINNVCSHQGGWLDQGELLADSCEVMCPLHDGSFDLKTGEATALPCKESVTAYTVRVEGDDILLGPAAV